MLVNILHKEIIIDVVSTLVSTGIIAIAAYIFRRKIIRAFSGKDLLDAKNIPNINVELVYIRQDDSNITLTVENLGETAISKIRLFKYYYVNNNEKMCIEILKADRSYNSANPGEGEKIFLDIPNIIDQYPNGYSVTSGMFLEMTDEKGIIFCLRIYLLENHSKYSPETYLSACPQQIKRLKKPLPRKKIIKDPIHLKNKYGIEITFG